MELHHPCDHAHPVHCQVGVDVEELEGHREFCDGVRARDLSLLCALGVVGDSCRLRFQLESKAALWVFSELGGIVSTAARLFQFPLLRDVFALFSR